MKFIQILPFCGILLLTVMIGSCWMAPESLDEVPESYTIDEIDLVPEGIAYSESQDLYYLTGVGKSKIITVDRKTGAQEDYIDEGEYGYAPGAGIYIDEQNEAVYALGGYYLVPDSLSTLFVFDLNTGELRKRYDVGFCKDHFLNDMIMDKNGQLYITDSKDSSVYILNSQSDSLELYYKSPEIEFPNGIAISDDQSKLYIASIPKGVRVLDLDSKEILNSHDTTGMTQGIDGLEFYKGNLYAVQNSVGANSFNFRKLLLSSTQDSIIGVQVIDSHTDRLDVPLTFCISHNQAVVIGNSNLQYLNQVDFSFKDSEAEPTQLIVYDID